MIRKHTTLLLGLAATLLLAACGGASEPGSPDETDGATDRPADTPPDDTTPDDDAGSDPNGTEPLAAEIDLAITDAAGHFDVDPSSIEVATAETVTWPDGALGCPQSGELYTQALVDGYRIRLEVDGQPVAYHGQSGGEPFRCDDPTEPAS